MPHIDYSIGFTQAEVEEILAVQKAELKKTLAAYANDGSTVTSGASTRSMPSSRPVRRPFRKLDPETYGRPVRAVRTGMGGYLDK